MREDALFLFIDVQEKLLPVMHESEKTLAGLCKLAEIAKLFAVPMIATEQYPKGLGGTVQALKEALPEDQLYLPKTTFSCMRDLAIDDAVKETERGVFIVAGIETHICVAQTVTDLLGMDYDVIVCDEAVSSRNASDKKLALHYLRDSGAFVLSAESIGFMLCEDAKAPEFKQLSALIK